MDYMLAAAAAALLNIGLLVGIMITYIQNMRLIKSYLDRKSTRLNSSHIQKSRMPSSA